ncbi:hypothetical protein ACWGIN_11170 [Streptomyces sp. NPDC054861]
MVRAVAAGTWDLLRGRDTPPVLRPHGGRLGLPAGFLIGGDGRIVAVKYGTHLDDQWPVDALLALAAAATAGRSGAPGDPVLREV